MSAFGLPDGISVHQTLAVLIPLALVTMALRMLPFYARRALQGSQLATMLGVMMPIGVMVVLVAYTLLSSIQDADAFRRTTCGLVALGATIGLHSWKRHPGISIFGGTAVYMGLLALT